MKAIQLLNSPGLLLTAVLMAGPSLVFGQTPTTNLNSFASSQNTEGVAPDGCGNAYGAGSILWDDEYDNGIFSPYPGTTGSGYLAVGYSESDGTTHPLAEYVCFPGDNWYWNGSGNVDLSLYSAVQFEVLWDTNYSNVPIDFFNSPTNLGFGSSSYSGLEIDFTTGSGDAGAIATGVQIPDAASNGWQTITVPIPSTLSGTAGTCGIMLMYWLQNEASALQNLSYSPAAYFWISDVNLIGTAGPPPPPILQPPVKTVSGLNIFASTDGNTYYDRQEVGLVSSNGISWAGGTNYTATYPVTYSFTIDGFSQNPGYGGCEAYLMMAPNPVAYDNAIDWNEANCVIFEVQEAGAQTLMDFIAKTNQPNNNSGDQTIGTVTNSGTALGTWSVTFNSETSVTMTAPNGNTSSFVFTNASYFAEAANPGMYLYLGMQANNSQSLNSDVCFSQFSITGGVPAAVSDNFLADSTLNTNVWFKFMADGPGGIFIMPSAARNWVSWSTPYAGFQLQSASSLFGPWTVLNDTNDITVTGVGSVFQLISTNDIPAGAPAAFFEMASP